MRYGEVLGSAFRGLKSGALWGFTLSVSLVIAAPFAVLAAAAFGLRGYLGIPLESAPTAAAFAMLGLTIVAATVALVFLMVLHAGMVHLSSEVLSGRAPAIGEGWRVGFARFGRTIGIEAVVGVLSVVAFSVPLAPLIALIVIGGTAAEQDYADAAVGLVVAGCCGFALFMLLMVFVLALLQAWEALAIRYAIVGERTLGDSLSAGWKALRAAFRTVAVFSVMVVALNYAYQMATSVILTPLQFVASGGFEGYAEPAYTAAWLPVIYLLSFLLAAPWMVFNYTLWTAFFRRLTGLDAPVAAPVAPVAGVPMPPILTDAGTSLEPPAPPAAPDPVPPAPPAPPPAGEES